MSQVRRLICGLAIAIAAATTTTAAEPLSEPSFERRQLSDQFLAEGAAFADINRDGQMDVVAGPYWYAGPDFNERFEIYPATPFDINGYSDNFFVFPYDINGDGWTDVLVVGFPGQEAFWFENPAGKLEPWERHLAFSTVDNESPTFVDLTGDGRPELVFHTGGKLGYAEIPTDDVSKPWEFHAISPDLKYERFNHGLGVGDVNGDDRPDILERNGWWEQPATAATADGLWAFHPFQFAIAGGAQMFAYDIDGDGDNDIITSKNGHGYGLSWFENVREGDAITFREHVVMSEQPESAGGGVSFSQLHAVALADMDGDDVLDIVTGKRFWAHGEHDPGAKDPAVLYWFQTIRDGKEVRFVPHQIDDNSGVGTQLVVGDANGDGRPDVVVGNKKGEFVFTQQAAAARDAADKQEPVAAGAIAKSGDAASNSAAAKDTAPKSDEYPYANIPADQAASVMEMPDGFSATVFAAEPDVRQPIAMALDSRGRVWIAEAYEYPKRAAEGQGRDRILIFEDTDGDGHFDKRTVFAEGLNLVSGLEVGFGGVWVGAAPELLFIPDRNGDDVPDGKPEVVLDGWGYDDTHETLNTFNWGPDGWLYGCHGVFTHSLVGKPGAKAEERVPLDAGYWRYHPTRHVFEVFAEGTSNSWGIDFNDWGQAISTACVIPHLWHVIEGARYQKQAGEHFNPYTYDDIKTIADHLHYVGSTPHSGNDRSDSAGGGHAHAGAMIYLGGAWPERYRNQVFMNNIHGQRVNMDLLKPHGSGYVGSHGPDFLLTRDRASQMLNFRYGPDGQVYVIDWYDMQACHDPNPAVHDRSNGRVYKITYGGAGDQKFQPVDVAKRSDLELAELTLDKNDWYVRQARRILQERAATGRLDAAAVGRLAEIATTNPDETRRLRAMWALHATGNLSPELIGRQLVDGNEYVRAWAIQLAFDREQPLDGVVPKLAELAKSDPSPVVRLYVASALQRIAPKDRWEAVAALVAHGEDAGDHNLPLMEWYAAEPLGGEDPPRALDLAIACGQTMPVVRNFMLRRIASAGTADNLAALVEKASQSADSSEQLAIIDAMRKALEGRRHVAAPPNWAEAYEQITESADEQLRNEATALGVTFGDPAALAAVRTVVEDGQADVAAQRAAIQSLLAAKDPQLVATLQSLLKDAAFRDLSLTGLALYDDPNTPSLVLEVYPELSAAEKQTALATLCARSAYGVELLRAIADKQIPMTDLSADLVRQLKNLKNSDVDQLLADVWGQVRTTPDEKAALIASYKQLLTAAPAAPPNPSLGRAVFRRTCQQCHTLYGAGNNIGPDLTGSNRSNIDYLLANIVDPSALIAKEYQPSLLVLGDGRVITGIVAGEDDKSVTVRTATEKLVVPKDEIEERSLSQTSMMPDDQLKQFSPVEVASLFAYLMGRSQVPMQATKENANLFFNGRDLAGWTGDAQLWSVENGEIVGRSPGIAHNSFLLSDLAAKDFRLSLEIKLVDDRGNTGIQFRTESLRGFEEVRGPQADAGPGWWGKLYEENGRQLLSDKSGEQFVHKGDWNRYEVLATGGHIQTWINGQPCVDLDDPAGRPSGVIGLQIHAGEPMEVRFRNLQLDVIDDAESATKAAAK